ncbi:MAG: hypothetical protein AABW81_02785 [Nanoarchaeota archaeon]
MKKERLTITVLLIIILLLLGLVSYIYFNNYKARLISDAYNLGIKDLVNVIMNNIKQQGYVQLFSGNETITLVEYKQK